MSRCWYCNEELTTANYCEDHMGICNDCYDLMFKVGRDVIHELQNKIKILEKALKKCYQYHKKHCTPADWVYHVSEEEYIKEMMKSE